MNISLATDPKNDVAESGTLNSGHRFEQVHGIYELQRLVPRFGDTVVNCFDVEVWKRATNLKWLAVKLVVFEGDVKVRLTQISGDNSRAKLSTLHQSGRGTSNSQVFRVSDLEGAILPSIEHQSGDAKFNLIFCTDDAPVRPYLKINYIFCTFKRAPYVQRNTKVFKEYIRRHRAGHEAHLTIVDNGCQSVRDNDCGVKSGPGVTVLPNNNTGGAGGFGRGIYDSCYGRLNGHAFTHVCLLDDDIYLDPEMFARNTALMRFLKPGFHVGAPMYPASETNKVPRKSACFGHKYRGTVHPSDTSLGGGLDTTDIPSFLNMDRDPDSTGWWWSCFAVTDVHRIGLPYPFFIKMDDVEYSLRLRDAGVKLVIPTSFWVLHDDFEEKYSAAMQYFRFRNRWLLLTHQGKLDSPTKFANEFSAIVKGFIEARKYEHAELLLNGMSHFLKGPKHLIKNEKKILSNIFKVVKSEKNGPMNEAPSQSRIANAPRVPANELPSGVGAKLKQLVSRYGEEVTIDTTRPHHPTNWYNAKKIHFWNSQKKVGFSVSTRPRIALNQTIRLNVLKWQLVNNYEKLSKRYLEAKQHYTSRVFWAGYGKFGHRQHLKPAPAHLKSNQDMQQAVIDLKVRSEHELARQSQPITEADNAFLNSVRNRYQGQRCFVLGNGPSLKVSDLDLLKDEITFAANKIYLSFDQTDWRPTFYSVEDLLVAQNCAPEIQRLTRSTKIFPHHMLPYIPRQANHHYARWLPPKDNKSPYREFSTDLSKGICWGSTITYSLIQMAVHMGFKEIYILGLDHSYVEPKTKMDGALVSEGEVNHFHPEYRKPGEKWHYPVLDRLEHSYQHAKDHCDSIGVQIYNASRYSELDTFPRADLDSVLSQK